MTRYRSDLDQKKGDMWRPIMQSDLLCAIHRSSSVSSSEQAYQNNASNTHHHHLCSARAAHSLFTALAFTHCQVRADFLLHQVNHACVFTSMALRKAEQSILKEGQPCNPYYVVRTPDLTSAEPIRSLLFQLPYKPMSTLPGKDSVQ